MIYFEPRNENLDDQAEIEIMNNNINNFTPFPGGYRTRIRANDTLTPLNSDSHEVPVIYRSRAIRDTASDRRSGILDPHRLQEDRTSMGTYSMPAFPGSSQDRTRIYVLNADTGRGLNSRQPGQMVRDRDLPPRSPSQLNRPISRATEDPRPTAMNKLRKEVYNPAPKLLVKRLSLYYRDNIANVLKEREREKEESSKQCAICLEDFEGGQEVMVTPCNHLFHEDCIMPWVTSNGQCPVCRFKICEKAENPSSFNNNNIANLSPSDLITGELLSIIGAMEEAFQLGNRIH